MAQIDSSNGTKFIKASMEIGFVRDAVGQANKIHDNLLKNQSVFGKVYGAGFFTLCKVFSVFKTTEEFFTKNFPKSMVQKTHNARAAVWSKLAEIDESFSGALSNQLKHHPILGKTMSDISGDINNYLKKFKIWNNKEKTNLIPMELTKKASDITIDLSKVNIAESKNINNHNHEVGHNHKASHYEKYSHNNEKSISNAINHMDEIRKNDEVCPNEEISHKTEARDKKILNEGASLNVEELKVNEVRQNDEVISHNVPVIIGNNDKWAHNDELNTLDDESHFNADVIPNVEKSPFDEVINNLVIGHKDDRNLNCEMINDLKKRHNYEAKNVDDEVSKTTEVNKLIEESQIDEFGHNEMINAVKISHIEGRSNDDEESQDNEVVKFVEEAQIDVVGQDDELSLNDDKKHNQAINLGDEVSHNQESSCKNDVGLNDEGIEDVKESSNEASLPTKGKLSTMMKKAVMRKWSTKKK